MKKPETKFCNRGRGDIKSITWIFSHARIDYTSLVGVSILDVGPAAYHGHMKVSDALR
jgi:hypothetical protein